MSLAIERDGRVSALDLDKDLEAETYLAQAPHAGGLLRRLLGR